VVVASGPAVVVLLILLAWPAARSSAQTLTVDTSGESMRIVAQGFSFLKGDPLVRLKDGQSVRVELTATVLPGPGGTEVATVRRIFALSYDLWEERFAVTTVEKRPQSMTHLAQPAAEAWCIEQLRIPMSALSTLGRDQPFWIRLEYRILDTDSSADAGESAFTLQALIDLLSRARKTQSAPQSIEVGPFRVKDRIGAAFRLKPDATGISPP
jgi:hypothetical protein